MLKYNIRKRKHWIRPFFCDNLKGGAYIVSKELKLDLDRSRLLLLMKNTRLLLN
jgi:hypothetical protein